MREQDIIFYENGRGGVALSVDGGQLILLANGKILPAEDTVWEVSYEDVEAKLTPVQRDALEEARKAPPLDELGEVLAEARRDRIRARKNSLQTPRPIPKVPEGALVVVSDFED